MSDNDVYTKEHYFVVKAVMVGDDIEFSVEDDLADMLFPEGMIWDDKDGGWERPNTDTAILDSVMNDRLRRMLNL